MDFDRAAVVVFVMASGEIARDGADSLRRRKQKHHAHARIFFYVFATGARSREMSKSVFVGMTVLRHIRVTELQSVIVTITRHETVMTASSAAKPDRRGNARWRCSFP